MHYLFKIKLNLFTTRLIIPHCSLNFDARVISYVVVQVGSMTLASMEIPYVHVFVGVDEDTEAVTLGAAVLTLID